MKQAVVFIGVFLSLALGDSAAQSFTFFSTLRAGGPSNSSFEIGTGTTVTANTVTSDFSYSNPYWRPGNGTQTFQIGWDAVSKAAFTRVQNSSGVYTSSTLSYGGPALPADALWQIPAGSFSVSAGGKNDPSSISIEGLTLSPNVTLVSGTLPSSMIASQAAGVSSQSFASDMLVINPAANGGSWFLQGTVRFSGLVSLGGTSRDSDLQLLLKAVGNPVPESESFALLGGGLVALVWFKRRSRSVNGSR